MTAKVTTSKPGDVVGPRSALCKLHCVNVTESLQVQLMLVQLLLRSVPQEPHSRHVFQSNRRHRHQFADEECCQPSLGMAKIICIPDALSCAQIGRKTAWTAARSGAVGMLWLGAAKSVSSVPNSTSCHLSPSSIVVVPAAHTRHERDSVDARRIRVSEYHVYAANRS